MEYLIIFCQIYIRPIGSDHADVLVLQMKTRHGNYQLCVNDALYPILHTLIKIQTEKEEERSGVVYLEWCYTYLLST